MLQLRISWYKHNQAFWQSAHLCPSFALPDTDTLVSNYSSGVELLDWQAGGGRSETISSWEPYTSHRHTATLLAHPSMQIWSSLLFLIPQHDEPRAVRALGKMCTFEKWSLSWKCVKHSKLPCGPGKRLLTLKALIISDFRDKLLACLLSNVKYMSALLETAL